MIFTDVGAIVSFATTSVLKEWQKKLFKKYRDEVQVHSKGLLFYKIDRLFPNEDDASKANRILSYEPVTKGSFGKGVSNIMRIFSNSSYSAQASKNTIDYITQTKFENKNLFTYFLDKWISVAVANDPNSLIVDYPPEYIKKGNRVKFISSEDILFYDNETFVFISRDESDVKYDIERASLVEYEKFYDRSVSKFNLRQAMENTYTERVVATFQKKVYHVFTQNEFYRIVLKDNSGDEYNVDRYVLKNFTDPPVRFAGGVEGENKTFESFFAPFATFGNLALLQHSQHTAVNFLYSFPRMSEVQNPCDNPSCKNGYVDCPVDNDCPEGKELCPVCNGTSLRVRQSPYKTYIAKFDPSGMQDNTATQLEMVKYYTPPVEVLSYSKDEWKNYLEMAEMAIYVQQKVQTGNVESAQSKQVDLEELFSFLLRVAKMFFENLRFMIQCEENYFNSAPITVSVDTPYSFAILTEEDAFDALNKILTSNAPDIIKGNQIDNFVSKFVSQASPVRIAYNVLKNVDVLFLKNDNQISTLKSNNVVTAEQWSIHTFAYPILMQMYYEDENIFDLETNEIVTRLNERLTKLAPVETPLNNDLRTKFLQPSAA